MRAELGRSPRDCRVQGEHGGGYRADAKAHDDDIYVPRHPRWYGTWLLPTEVDLRRWHTRSGRRCCLPPVLDQGDFGTCVAHAAANCYAFALAKEARVEEAFVPRRAALATRCWPLQRWLAGRCCARCGLGPAAGLGSGVRLPACACRQRA